MRYKNEIRRMYKDYQRLLFRLGSVCDSEPDNAIYNEAYTLLCMSRALFDKASIACRRHEKEEMPKKASKPPSFP